MKKTMLKKGETSSFNFNYDLTNLPSYNSYGDDMMIKSFLGLTLPKYSSLRLNLKGTTEKIGFVTNDVILQDLSCGFTPTGITEQNLVTVNLANKKYNSELCPYSLFDTYLSKYLSNDNFLETVPFEEVILQDISNRVNNKIELSLWRNTVASGATEFNSQPFDGVKTLISSGNGATQLAYTACTATNALDVFTSIYQAIPENVLERDDLIIWCGYADYRALVASMRNNSFINLFTDETGSANLTGTEMGVMLPASNCRVVPTQGLSGQSYICAGPAQYIFVGLNSEFFSLKSLYDPFADVIKLNLHATFGCGVAFVDSFVVVS